MKMIALTAVLCALAVSVSAGVSLKRRDGAPLITSCNVPNTVAFTFVRLFSFIGNDSDSMGQCSGRWAPRIHVGHTGLPVRPLAHVFRTEIVDMLKAVGGKGTFFVSKSLIPPPAKDK